MQPQLLYSTLARGPRPAPPPLVLSYFGHPGNRVQAVDDHPRVGHHFVELCCKGAVPHLLRRGAGGTQQRRGRWSARAQSGAGSVHVLPACLPASARQLVPDLCLTRGHPNAYSTSSLPGCSLRMSSAASTASAPPREWPGEGRRGRGEEWARYQTRAAPRDGGGAQLVVHNSMAARSLYQDERAPKRACPAPSQPTRQPEAQRRGPAVQLLQTVEHLPVESAVVPGIQEAGVHLAGDKGK